MAVINTPIATSLVLTMDNGLGAAGQQLKINRTVNYIKPAALDADIYAVAQGLLGLQDKTNLSIQRANSSELTEQL